MGDRTARPGARLALVVIEEGKAVTKGKVGEAAVDVAEGEGKLIRIG